MIIKTIALALTLCGLLVTPVRAESYVTDYSHITMEVSESYANDDEVFGTVTINGKHIQLPCKASLILDLGFIPEEDKDIGKKSHIDWLRLYDKQGREIVISGYNSTDKTLDLGDCTVYRIYYDPSEDIELGFLDYNIMGVSGSTNAASIELLLGEPRSSYGGDDYNSATYTSPKAERRVEFRWRDSGQLIDMSTSVEYPSEVYDYKYAKDDMSVSADVEEDKRSPLFFLPIIAVAGMLIVGSAVCAIAVSMNKKRRRTQEILDTPIDELSDSILEKYGDNKR